MVNMVMVVAVWAVLPFSDAFGTGSWTYPDNSAVRMQRIQELNGYLEGLSVAHVQQIEAIKQMQKVLADLEAGVLEAQKALIIEERPVAEVMEKYRKAQELSLIDPKLSTETQRMELVKVKEANKEAIAKRKAQIDALSSRIPQVRADIENASKQINIILSQIDGLIKQRDEVTEQVFMKTVGK